MKRIDNHQIVMRMRKENIMRDQVVEDELFRLAEALIKKRYPIG